MRLRREAIELLRKAIPLTEDSFHKAWCYFNLARALNWLRMSQSQIREAFDNAIALVPSEKTFREAYDRWRTYNRNF